MDVSNLLIFDESKKYQDENDLCFVGGFPKIPADIDIPTCKLCNSQLTFFFQVAFPNDHLWSGKSLAMFACTSCVDRKYFIPEMLKGPLLGIDIPHGFLLSYQKNFRILVFDTQKGIIRKDYSEKVKFKKWNLKVSALAKKDGNKIGGIPNWVLDDESPSTYNSTTPMIFLMQLKEGFKFDILPDAPRQMQLNYFTNNVEPNNKAYYELFLGNNIYFFGTKDKSNPLVYIITQID
ncbi:hypothetical protein [Acetivibrio clariflavus]|uniref:hypothetical protein n=1 Tax=Acetivibrio clariflavus TaxID=288965 RepID=UPI0004AC6C71|nr:hypothetical protein [Acetivibrio clariflavus]